MYKLIRKIIEVFSCDILFHVKYENLDVLEKYEKCIICPNHSRSFDPIFLYPQVKNMYSVAKSDLFKNKIVAHFLKYHNAIPIKRNSKDIQGIKHIINVLEEKTNIRLLIFPEGGVFKENYIENKRKVKSGAVYISATTNTPIIPVHITVRPKFFSKVLVKFGEPIYFDSENLNDRKLLKENSTKLINTIYELDPLTP